MKGHARWSPTRSKSRCSGQRYSSLRSGLPGQGPCPSLQPAGRGFRSQQHRPEPPCQSTRRSGKARSGASCPKLLRKNDLFFQTDWQGGVTFKGLYVFLLYLGSSLKTELNHVFCLRTSSHNYKPPTTALEVSSHTLGPSSIHFAPWASKQSHRQNEPI